MQRREAGFLCAFDLTTEHRRRTQGPRMAAWASAVQARTAVPTLCLRARW